MVDCCHHSFSFRLKRLFWAFHEYTSSNRAPWMIYSSQVCIGLANATLFVCSYSHALSVARMHGYPDNVETKSFVSSSFFAFTFFGGIITPPIAGHLSESYGYRSATMIMFALMTAWIPVRMATWVWCSCVLRKRKSYDMDPVRDGLARYWSWRSHGLVQQDRHRN